MTGGDFYSASAARRSLGQFVAGKLVSAALGVAFLLVTVRAVEPADYGRYVAVLALAEVFYLVSGLGLSTVAQRYVAEYRLRAPAPEFRTFLFAALRRRAMLSIVFAAGVALVWHPMMRWTGIALPSEGRMLLVLLLVASAGVGFLDEVMGALLMQGYAQGLVVVRNVLKLTAVIVVLLGGTSLGIEFLLQMEAIVALISWACAEILVRRWAHAAPSAPGARADYASVTMASVAWRFYVVQLIWTVYSPSAVKLLVTRLLGATQTAALGFAQSVTDMLRNYMPAYLLATWLRPVMVSRYVANRDLGEVSLIAGLAFKLNLVGLLFAAALFAVIGDPLMQWLTRGRYPQLGWLLVLLSVVVAVQSAHWLLQMITVTLEQPGANLHATLAAAVTLPLLVLATMAFGVHGAAAGLLAAELAWVATAWLRLRQRGFELQADGGGIVRILLAAALCVGVGALCRLPALALPWWTAGIVMPISYALLLIPLRPFAAVEVRLVRRFLALRGRPPAAA